MPATSLASAARPEEAQEAVAPRGSPRLMHQRMPAQQALWPQALRAAVAEAFRPALLWYRATWLYRQRLLGPVPDRILFHPTDTRLRKLDEADGFMRGRFRLGGQRLDVRQGSIFDAALPGESFAAALHGFDWLRHVEAAGGDLAKAFALKVTQQWLKRYARFTPFVWRTDIVADRLLNLFAHGRFFLVNSDLVWRSRLFVSLRDQAQFLARTIDEAPPGLSRFKCAAALTLAGICLGDGKLSANGLKRLSLAIEREILPDGGHLSRSPAVLLEIYRLLAMVQESDAGVHPSVRGALDRIGPMLRFFRLGDGALAVFHGGNESDARTVEATLDGDDVMGRPLGHAPYSGYQRLACGRTLVLLDAGAPPSGVYSNNAHAGCLAFEMSTGAHRLIVNCGLAVGESDAWVTALRSTAAHSTLTMGDMSSASFLSGRLAKLLAPRLVEGPALVETRRNEDDHGLTVDANHDGYLAPFGVVHQRRMTLSPRGTALTGVDRLIPAGPERRVRHTRKIPFHIRFHVHPDVRLSMAQGGTSVILKLSTGEGWRFRSGSGVLSIEESVYFGSGAPRRCEQLVVSGEWFGELMECAWLFEQLA
jgi:uncharacterized heparinase superfamily protein